MEDILLYSGRKLKEIRMSRGIELDEIVEATKVRKKQLIKIEEEKYGELPAKIFLKGFLMSYASHLGLDSQKVVNDILKKVEENNLLHVDNQLESQYS